MNSGKEEHDFKISCAYDFISPYHHNLPCRTVADFDHIDTRSQRLVADAATNHIVHTHLVGCSLNHDVVALAIDADALRLDVADALGAAVSGDVAKADTC